MPLVSVLMTAYNRESLVGESIASIENQTFEDWELIILDDASTDRTLDVCKSFESQDKRIKVFTNKENLGLGENRKLLMSMGSGKYICSHDSDDLSVPERLAWTVEVLETRPEIGLVSGVVAFIDDADEAFSFFPKSLSSGQQYPQDKRKMVEMLYADCIVQIGACTFRRSLAELFPGKYRIGDDWHFLLHAAHRRLFWGIPKVLLKVRRGRNHQHLWKDPEDQVQTAENLLRTMYEVYKDDPESPIDYKLYRKCLAPWLAKRGKYYGGWKGYWNVLQAVLHDPSNSTFRSSLWSYSGRAFKKAKRLALG